MSSTGGVSVCCRFRPLTNRERELDAASGREHSIRFQDNTVILGSESGQQFSFDVAWSPNVDQKMIFDGSVLPLVDSIMAGFNVTVFAYGQTGSGKTYTMMGDSMDADGISNSNKNRGIIPRLVESIFDQIEEADEEIEFTIKVSYVEIYNEKIRDLLDPSKVNLRLRESSTGVWIDNVTEAYVGDQEGVINIMAQGTQNRAVASTNMNEASSRSHSVVVITLGQNNQKTGVKKGAKLFLVDLAGSEKVMKTGAEGHKLVEAQHINRSLSALGVVINKLTTPGSKHIPYRDSKLTRLLSDALGGNSKTVLLITCSPALYNLDETYSTLRFGARAKLIKNKPKANVVKSIDEYKRLLQTASRKSFLQTAFIEELQDELTSIRQVETQTKIKFPPRRQSFLGSLNLSEMSHTDVFQAVTKYKRMSLKKGMPLLPEVKERENENENKLSFNDDSESEGSGSDHDDNASQSQEQIKQIEVLQARVHELENEQRQQARVHMAMSEQYNFAQKKLEHLNDVELRAEMHIDQIELLQRNLKVAESGAELATNEHKRVVTELADENSLLKTKLAELMATVTDSKKPTGNAYDGRLLSSVDDFVGKTRDRAQSMLALEEQNANTLIEFSNLQRSHQEQEAAMVLLQKDNDDLRNELKQTTDALQAANAKHLIDQEVRQKRIAELEAKLQYAEHTCQRLVESGMYWREKRRQESLLNARNGVIKHIHGGGHARASAAQQQSQVNEEKHVSSASSMRRSSLTNAESSPVRNKNSIDAFF